MEQLEVLKSEIRTVQILPVTGKDAVFRNIQEKTFYVEKVEFIRFTTYIIDEEDDSESVETDIYPITSTDLSDSFCCNDKDILFKILDRQLKKPHIDNLISRGFKRIYSNT